MNEILCPVDFSEVSLNAIEFGANLCQAIKGNITLLHVGHDNKEVRSLFSNLVRVIEDEKGIRVETYVVDSEKVARSIVREANSGRFKYTVMGTEGARDVEEAYIGSNTVQVLEDIKTPIFCIPRKADFMKSNTFVYASDYHDEDIRIIQEVCAFAGYLNAQVKVLHVARKDRSSESKKFDHFKQKIEESVYYDKLRFENIFHEGEVDKAIDHYVEEEEGDLVILSTFQRSRIEQLFHRSVSKRLSYMLNYPLLVFKT